MENELPAVKARINLTGEFSALELEEVIRTLATARASLEPAVPMQPPTLLATEEVLVQEEASFNFRTLIGGGLRIWLRNEGLGWLAFTLTQTDVAGIREFLGQQPGNNYTSH